VTYINRVGHVSVPEDLWADMMQAMQQFVEIRGYIATAWKSEMSPEDQQVMLQDNNKWATVLRRARELDALHRKAQYEAGRSTREQIERGGSSGPYGS
jgi:hypothetical protein